MVYISDCSFYEEVYNTLSNIPWETLQHKQKSYNTQQFNVKHP